MDKKGVQGFKGSRGRGETKDFKGARPNKMAQGKSKDYWLFPLCSFLDAQPETFLSG
jgi:hypothetical protein